MRRLVMLGLALTLAPAAVAAPLELINVSASGLHFLIVRRAAAAPAHPTAQLIGCVEGHPNCRLARARGLLGERLTGCEGVGFHADEDLKEQILAAFRREGASATIELDFEPAGADGEPNRVIFARR